LISSLKHTCRNHNK